MTKLVKRILAGFYAIQLYRDSPLFDKEYYSKTYHIPRFLCIFYDVLIGRHYDNNPSEEFSTKKYLESYPDIKASGMPALYHYLRYGIHEGRYYESVEPEYSRCPLLNLFNKSWYTETYLLSIPEWSAKPLKHYKEYGWKNRFLPFENFDIDLFYLENPYCKEEPLEYWYRNRLPKLYFKDIRKAVKSKDSRLHRQLQLLYHYVQDSLIHELFPPSSQDCELILFFAPDYGSNDLEELFTFQSVFQKADTEKKDQIVLASSRPGTPTYTYEGKYSVKIPIVRYSLISLKFKECRSVMIVTTDLQLPQFYEYMKYNLDDPIHHHRNKTLKVLDYGRVGDIRFQAERAKQYFNTVLTEISPRENLYSNPYLCFFDSKWYEKTYPIDQSDDPITSYLQDGWRQHNKPFEFFDVDSFYRDYPDCPFEPLYFLYRNRIPKYYFTEKSIPKMHFEGSAGQAMQSLYRIRQEETINSYLPFHNTSRRLMLILVSPEDAISGGIMSFYGIYYLSKQMKSVHERDIIVSTIPGDTTQAGFTMFKNDMPVFRYELVARRVLNAEDILVMIPEIYVRSYLQYLIENTEDPILSIKNRHLNIMNQKIEVMPDPEVIDDMRLYFPVITQTVAHYKYCTPRERAYYGIPSHLLLPPIIKHFKLIPYEQKEQIFAYSYDEQPWKQKMLNVLKRQFPDLQFIEIVNMSFDDYLDLIHRAKWCMTFGEGLDGYFSEPYQAGGISFAIWNEDYFTDRYKSLPTVLKDVDYAMEKLPDLMRSLDNKEEYEKTSMLVRTVHGQEYATSRTSKDQLLDFFEGRYDFP